MRIKVFLFHQKLLTYQITVMRGIQINNYFNNHITLNGKKINQESQSIAQTSRQKLHGKQIHPQEPILIQAKTSPAKAHPTPLKKRTNTLVQLKKHIPQKRSISVQRQRNAVSGKKKDEPVSDQDEKQEELLINMSQKKFKPNSNKGGLGKRSKSTIIKTSNVQAHKETIKKEQKKLSSNHTNQSAKPLKSKRKKSSKISEVVKQNKQIITPKVSTARKELPQTASKEVFKKDKLALKFDKNIKHDRTQKKSARNSKNIITNQTKTTKPVSARQKKMKKNRFIEELKEKYENQTILQGQLSSSRLRGSEQGMDNEFLSVMNSLEKILNSVGSKQKLRKQLDIINEKLREFKLQTEEEDEVNQKPSIQNNFEEISRSLEIQFTKEQERRAELVMEEESDDDEESEEEEEEPLPHKISEQDEIFMRLQGEEVKNPLIGKRSNVIFIEEKPETSQNDDRRKEIELLKRFKGESTKMMEKVGLARNANTQSIQIQEKKPQRKLTLQNVSGISNGSNSSHKWQDKYPQGNLKSPKFDDSQLLNAIELKQQFISSKHDKMSELVKKMFEKQLVSPKSFQFQMKSLNKKYEEEKESFKKQAEQLSSMLSQIKKDKEEIKGIDQLIRNQKWEEAQKYVEKKEVILQQINQHEQYEKKWQKSHEEPGKTFELTGWQKEGGWERVRIKRSQVENNEFVDIGEMTNRGRRRAQANFEVDIDEQCGGTEESEELQPHQVRPDKNQEQEYIYYNEDNDQDKQDREGGLIRLVQIPEQANESDSRASTTNVFHIKDQEPQRDNDHEGTDRNSSFVPSVSERGGFTTNLYFIKEYCIAICEFVRDNEIFKTQFKQNVSKPLEFHLQNILKEYREEDSSSYIYQKRTHKPAIPEIIWNEFNSQYETLKYNSHHPSSQDPIIIEKHKLQKYLQVIFIRMVYDTLNESLDFQRPGGLFGKAFPWRQSARHLKNLKQLNKSQEDNIQAYDLMFGVAIARIIQWGSCLCGFLPDTVQLQNTEIDQAYVNHIRQTRTAFLLQKMMAEQQQIMTNFELQQTEVQYRLAQLIYQQLLEQAGDELSGLLF